MTIKKKPEGPAWEEFVRQWYSANHEGKVSLARSCGVGYDTAKHWVSDSGSTMKKEDGPPQMRFTVEDLLHYDSSMNLDFVSFDIETSGLDADFSILLSAVVKPFGCQPVVFRADQYPEWETNRANDYGITKAIGEELSKHAVVITHYGSKFDIPYIKVKLVHHRLPSLGNVFGIDTWAIAWKNFKVSRRSLQNLGLHFGIGEKSSVEGPLWMDAAYSGSKEALDKIVEHNIQDCVLLEKLACLSLPYTKSLPRL